MKALLIMASSGQGRIVSTGDLNEHQIAEALSNGKMFVDENGFGFVLLPWSLTTDKDKRRERQLAILR